MMWTLSKFKNNIAIIKETGEKVSYGEMHTLSEELKGYIPKRCLTFILCSNELGSVLGYVTFLNNKIVPLMVDSNLEQDLLKNLIKTYKPDYLWVPEKKFDQFKDYEVIYKSCDYCLVKTDFDNVYSLNEDLALLLTTSGSTGSFKLVRQSYENIQSNMNSIVEYLNLTSSECAISTLPMHYTYGISIINSHFAVGASLILTEKTLMQKEFWHQLKDFKATSLGGVPYTYEMLEKLRFFRMNLPHLKTLTQAGGRLSIDLHEKFAKYAHDNDKKFVVMYGQTEATARMSYLPHEKSLEKIGSIGLAIPGGEFSIIDLDGNKINKPNTAGELIYKGKNVTLGYATCGSDLSKDDERNGILETGDIAKVDEDGFYYIVGRKKRFLKMFGSRVNLDETEQLIKEEFKNIDCVCTGFDDYMYIFTNVKDKENDILNFISQKTGINHIAFKVKFIPAIPRNSSGKVLYPKLEEYYD